MTKTILVFILSLACFSSMAQSHITGKVTAVSGETLQGASIVIKNTEDKIISYTDSDENGYYVLDINKSGVYHIEVLYLGFEKQKQTIEITGRPASYNFVLKESQQILNEVVIEHEQPVKMRGDTLVYDAKKLVKGHETVVEDLLKNIPGVTILNDGKIFYGEKEVEKVMVDGDDLFNRGYSLLTKNMPVNPLDKIEVLQNYSNNKLLKGIEDSGKVALNLTIDDKFKTLWFGDASLAYGNDNRYNAGGNLMNFGKNYKNFFTVNMNNAGYDKVGDISGMIYNSNDVESTGSSIRAASVMNMSISGAGLGEERSRFNNTQMATLSTIIPLNKKIKLQLKGFLNFDELSAWNNSYSVIDIPGTFFENTQANSAKDRLKTGYFNALLNYEISPTQLLQISSSVNKGSKDYRNNLVYNGTPSHEELKTHNTYFDQKATYSHQWQKRNVVLLKARFTTETLPQQYGIDDYLMGYLFPYENINAIGNDSRSKKQFAALQADFKLKQKNNDLIEFNIGYHDNRDDLTANFSLFTDDGTVLPDGFQSHSKYNVGDLYANGGYKWDFSKYSFGVNLSAHQLFNSFTGAQQNSSKQNPFYINPNINASYIFNPYNVISASYSYRINNSGLLQINDAYLLSSSRSFLKGLGDFNQMESSSGALDYTTKHYLNRYSFSWRADYSRQNDVIQYRSQLEQNSSLSEAFIIKGGEKFGAAFNTHFVIKKLKGSLAGNIRAGKLVYYNVINDSGLRRNISYTQEYSLIWRSDFKGAFDFNIGTQWNFRQTQSENTFKNNTKISFLDIMYKTNDKFTLKVRTENYNFGGLDARKNYYFSDIESSYSFSEKKYILSLDARNLFNTKSFTNYSISDYGYSTINYRLLPRYILLSIKMRF